MSQITEECVLSDKIDIKTKARKQEDHPDGGFRGWLVVLGITLAMFTLFGLVNSWGVFQAFYETDTLRSRTPSEIAWIGSIQYSLLFMPCLFWGRLFDMGYFKSMLVTSSILIVLAVFLIAECQVYWQFLLCQGVAIGLAGSGVLAPAPMVLSQWFKKRRGLAMCIYAFGASVGGTVLPIATRELIPRIGFAWTMRVLGFISLISLGAAILLIERKDPPSLATSPLLNTRAFRSGPYTVYCLATLFIFLGIYAVLVYIDISAVSHGVPPEFAFYLVAIANASSGISRCCAGLLVDRVGPINVMMPFTLGCAVFTYAWPFARTKGALVAIAVLYGSATGSFLALIANPVMEFGDPCDVGKDIGMLMSIMAFGALLGPPIAGAINSATGGFEAVGYFAGSAIVVGVLFMLWCKQLALGSIRGKI